MDNPMSTYPCIDEIAVTILNLTIRAQYEFIPHAKYLNDKQ